MGMPEKGYFISKRLLDIFVAYVALIIISPVLIVTAVIVRMFMGEPTLFRTERAGLCGKSFTLLKFRSMKNAYDVAGNPLPDEQRITSLGRFIRRNSLDEVLQLLNILKGDMSLVGPRPLPMKYNGLYNERQALRLKVKPGLTGWCQIKYRGNERTWEEKLEQDAYYVDHCSFWFDIHIIVLTMAAVWRRLILNQSGLSTSLDFVGHRNQKNRMK